MDARDIAIRTILGEAANESPMGQAAVAHVLMNRAADPRWPSTIQDVALQPKQFSAWNSGAGGNDLVNKYGPGSNPYEKVGAIYDAVAAGQIADPTGGATHYYSPAGMEALVSQGAQSNILPRWLQQENEYRGSPTVTIGGHIFTGKASSEAGLPAATVEPELPEVTWQQGLADAAEWLAPQPIVQPDLGPSPQVKFQPRRRDTSAAYRTLFEGI